MKEVRWIVRCKTQTKKPLRTLASNRPSSRFQRSQGLRLSLKLREGPWFALKNSACSLAHFLWDFLPTSYVLWVLTRA